MTNAIEQSKREMYAALEEMKGRIQINYSIKDMTSGVIHFEGLLEDYLELLRQDHEALHETARKRFEDIQSLEAVNKDLIEQLGNMTERRDYFRNQVQAANHACKTRQDQSATPTQDSLDRASCATMDGKTAAILGAVVDVRAIITDWGVGDLKAKKAMLKIAGVVNGPTCYSAMHQFERPDTYGAWFIANTQCMHSFPSGEQCVFCGVGK